MAILINREAKNISHGNPLTGLCHSVSETACSKNLQGVSLMSSDKQPPNSNNETITEGKTHPGKPAEQVTKRADSDTTPKLYLCDPIETTYSAHNDSEQNENINELEENLIPETEDKNTNRMPEKDNSFSNVVNLFTGQSIDESPEARIVRIVGEQNGTRMLYANYDHPERLIAVPILCWALTESGEIFGMVPWLDEILPCHEIEEKYSVCWEGYFNIEDDDIFFEPPAESTAQLTVAARFPTHLTRKINPTSQSNSALAYTPVTLNVIQEIPDPVGTHALLINSDSDSLLLTSIVSWALDENGEIHGMLADDSAIEKLPVLPGDECLFSATSAENFKCYFQRDIAEQIRTQNPKTLEAIEQLFAN